MFGVNNYIAVLSFFAENSSDKTKVKIVGFIDKVRGIYTPSQSTSIFLLIYLIAVIFLQSINIFRQCLMAKKLHMKTLACNTTIWTKHDT